MNKFMTGVCALCAAVTMASCNESPSTAHVSDDTGDTTLACAEWQILQYKVPGWEEIDSQQKELAYCLYEAALSGRDIIYGQRGKYNLTIRNAIGAIWAN